MIYFEDFGLQVRVNIAYDLWEMVEKDDLDKDFFYVISLVKQNYEKLKKTDKTLIMYVDLDMETRDVYFSLDCGKGEYKAKRDSHTTMSSMFRDALDLEFDESVREIPLGYTVNYAIGEDRIYEEGSYDSEIHIGAIPGTLQVFYNDELVIAQAWMKEREPKKYYKDGVLVREDMTVIITPDNLKQYFMS